MTGTNITGDVTVISVWHLKIQ